MSRKNWFIPSAEKGSFDCFSVGFFFFVIWFAGVIVPLYPFIMSFDGFSQIWNFNFSDKSAAIRSALILYTAALFFVLLGCYFGRKLQLNMPAAVRCIVSAKVFFFRSFVFTVIALLALVIILIALGGLSGLLQGASDRIRAFAGLNGFFLLQNLLLSVSLAWFIRLTGGEKKNLSERVFFWLYFFIGIFVCGLQGQKSTIFIIVLSLIVVRHYRVQRVSLVKGAVLGFVMFISLMAYHLFKQEFLVSGKFSFINDEQGVFLSFVNFLAIQFTGNLMQLQTMSVLVDAMPRLLDWQNGTTLLMIVLILIPSGIFPNKPMTAAGVFTGAFWPNMWLREGTTLPPGIFGELYMNFGTLGVLLGGLLLGVLWGWLYGVTINNPKSDRALGVYALTVASMLHLFRGELASVALLVASILIPFLLLSSKRQEPVNNSI
ncbi:oligosaccharide repeat unit polymerase [Pseudomonas chlororaphis]|uniref:oligosaccharide repeat unit polymerase n=1 Tax=Pseudomonas chlororaphis TaxID=587753 RepID=UPI000D0EF436|nr:oligosaccharide repeat unit polymerase [Pseudomonas chlororaphis]AVO60415.1 oligosaccharide repeat unit polymerase [Pseudomonas chlororaphis subsp. piscium]